jgi:hypothetical protein
MMAKVNGEVNAQYNLAAPESLPIKFATSMRRVLYARFIEYLCVSEADTILDVGATSDQTYESSNYLEAWHPYKHRITAAGIDDASFLEVKYPGVTFIHADGRKLPFDDASFDFVHSSAVIEHVGSLTQQGQFVAELARVARKGFMLTTPNRWYPIEFHTLLPLLHWLPKSWHRHLLRKCGLAFHAEESNLNLMSARQLEDISQGLVQFDTSINSTRLFGWPSNLILWGRREPY